MSQRLMRSLRSRNISQIITERIVASILNGELQPGERLPTEDDFAARIGAGKSSVREAIKILEALGVLEIRRGDGTYVVDEFKGAMLDPLMYGILFAERNTTDVVDFKIGVQRMASEDLLAHGIGDQVALLAEQFASSISEHDRAEGPFADPSLLNEKMLVAEEQLAALVANPLIGELYRRSVRIAAHAQEPRASELTAWLCHYLDALGVGDAAVVASLLAEERSILLSSVPVSPAMS